MLADSFAPVRIIIRTKKAPTRLSGGLLFCCLCFEQPEVVIVKIDRLRAMNLPPVLH